jgi:hypothetical protein
MRVEGGQRVGHRGVAVDAGRCQQPRIPGPLEDAAPDRRRHDRPPAAGDGRCRTRPGGRDLARAGGGTRPREPASRRARAPPPCRAATRWCRGCRDGSGHPPRRAARDGKPDRGHKGDRKAGYHDPDAVPCHAYLAFHLALRGDPALGRRRLARIVDDERIDHRQRPDRESRPAGGRPPSGCPARRWRSRPPAGRLSRSGRCRWSIRSSSTIRARRRPRPARGCRGRSGRRGADRARWRRSIPPPARARSHRRRSGRGGAGQAPDRRRHDRPPAAGDGRCRTRPGGRDLARAPPPCRAATRWCRGCRDGSGHPPRRAARDGTPGRRGSARRGMGDACGRRERPGGRLPVPGGAGRPGAGGAPARRIRASASGMSVTA